MMRRACLLVAAFSGVLAGGAASAGGPLIVRTNGQPYTWNTAAPIEYRTDNGPLSASVSEAAARSRVQSMFAVWQDVASASIAYSRAGFIDDVTGFGDGDVSTAGEYNAVEGDCNAGNQSPVIYDAAAEIFIATGVDETSVIGFAGPCAFETTNGHILSGQAVMNGLFQDGTNNPVVDLPAADFDTAFVHEFGHFSGLDHSQVNVECADGACGPDDQAGVSTMFPFLMTSQQGTPSIDDVAWISKLYPAAGGAGFSATHGILTGTVFFSDGESHAQLVNVVARRVDNGATPADESRTTAGSGVSGQKFRLFHGNPINEPSTEPLGPFGDQVPGNIGFYEIPLPPGSYMISVESIDPQFVDGSSVGGSVRIAMPGASPPPIGPVTVTAGATFSGNDVVLIGTPPRFDQFEGS